MQKEKVNTYKFNPIYSVNKKLCHIFTNIVLFRKYSFRLGTNSDIDLFIICDDLPEDYWERRKLVFNLTKSVCSGKQAFWRTSKEMEGHVKSKYYLILDAFDEGKILYDPENFLFELKKKLFKDLEEKGVIRTELYWQWPIKKFGDKIEF